MSFIRCECHLEWTTFDTEAGRVKLYTLKKPAFLTLEPPFQLCNVAIFRIF
jgi:hypothetical protein